MMAVLGISMATAIAVAADKPKANHPARPQTVTSPQGNMTHGTKAAVKVGHGNGGAQTQKVDGWGLAKGIGNLAHGAVKVVTGKVDAGVDQIKHGADQVKTSTDKDDSNNPSNQTNTNKK
jgi:hypothetical protein